MSDRMRLRIGGGLLGTGRFLQGRRATGVDAWDARAWVTVLFVPLVPLRATRLRGPSEGPIVGEAWDVERLPPEAPPRADVLKTYGAAAGLLVAALAPAWFAWRTIHQTDLLQALEVVVGASVPVLVLMWLDLRTPKIVG